MGGVDWASVAIFLAFAFGLSWACFIGLSSLGVAFQIRASIGMFGPAVAALLTRVIRRERFGDLGLRPRLDRAFLYAYLIPLMLAAAGVVLSLVIGYQRWDLLQNWQLRLTLTAPEAAANPATSRELLVLQFVQALTIATFINCFFTLGEELGWRGHLLPRLTPLGGPAAAVVVGAVWGLWHAPLIALDGYEFGIKSWAVAPFFCLTTIPTGVILAWLRFRSGSVWPAVLMHAGINALAGLTVLSLSAPTSRLVAPTVGLLGVAPTWAVALLLIVTGRVREQRAAAIAAPSGTKPASPSGAWPPPATASMRAATWTPTPANQGHPSPAPASGAWQPAPTGSAHPAATPSTEIQRVEDLSKLNQLLDEGVLTREEFEREKQRILRGR